MEQCVPDRHLDRLVDAARLCRRSDADQRHPLVGLFRTAVFQVWLVPWIAVAILWGWIFNSDYGIVNFVLIEVGVLAHPQKWLADPLLAQLVIISAFTWRQIPFMMVVALAALQGIPGEVIEAAAIDGAGYARQLVHIVLPLVRNVMTVVALLQAVRLFQEITLPWVLTQGRPDQRDDDPEPLRL